MNRRDALGVFAAMGVAAATPIECLHYALNLPTSVVITGCESINILGTFFDGTASHSQWMDDGSRSR